MSGAGLEASLSDAEKRQQQLIAYQTERSDLSATYSYMCTLIGVAAAYIGAALVLLQESLPSPLLVAVPMPLMAVAGLVVQSYANLELHGSYANYLEARLTGRGIDAPLGSTLSQPIYGDLPGLFIGDARRRLRPVALAFRASSVVAPVGFFLSIVILIVRCLQLSGWSGIGLAVVVVAYGLLTVVLVEPTVLIAVSGVRDLLIQPAAEAGQPQARQGT